MIKVRRGEAEKASGFDERTASWRAGFERARLENPALTPGHYWERMGPKIQVDKAALQRAFHDKCAFCEAPMAHVGRAQIEHYRPKQRFPALMFDWENWLLSCGRCNEKKWAHFPVCGEKPCLLNPAGEDETPDEHLTFINAQILPVSERGQVTIRLLGLDRSPLEDERDAWLRHINTLLLLAAEGASETQKEARDLLVASLQTNARFSACTRAYIGRLAPKLLHATPPPHLPDLSARIRALLDRHIDTLAALC